MNPKDDEALRDLLDFCDDAHAAYGLFTFLQTRLERLDELERSIEEGVLTYSART